MAARQQAVQPRAVALRVGDRARAAVEVEHHERRVPDPLDHRLDRRRDRLEDEPERAGVEHLDAVREGGERVLHGQPGHGGPVVVEAVGRRAVGIELGERERGRVVGGDDRREAHPVGLELLAQAGTEAVGGDAAEIGHRLLEAPERARAVERAAAQMRAHLVAVADHEVDQRLPADQDHGRKSTSPGRGEASAPFEVSRSSRSSPSEEAYFRVRMRPPDEPGADSRMARLLATGEELALMGSWELDLRTRRDAVVRRDLPDPRHPAVRRRPALRDGPRVRASRRS